MADTPIPRRHVLAGTALALTAWMLPRRLAAAQTHAAPREESLTARPGLAALAGPERPPTAVWGFDGVVPGPLLRMRRGEEFTLRLRNDLPEPSAIHWHGLRIPNAMDGTALVHTAVPTGGSFEYRFIPPDAGTFWYHAPLARQSGRGLSGMLIVEETTAVEVDREVVLVFDDWRLRADGSIATPGSDERRDTTSAAAEDLVTVNGGPSMPISVRRNERLRLRVLNASTSRGLAFAFDRHLVTVMALDGQPSEPFAAREGRVALGPGNRVDLFLDATLEPGAVAAIRVAVGGRTFEPARLVYDTAAPLRPAPLPAPKPLPANPLPARMQFAGALRRELRMEQTSAETRVGGTPLFTVKRGQTVVLALDNRSNSAKAVHVHGHHFRLLDRLDDGWKPFWLDTLVVPPRETWRIAFVADNPGRWMIDMATLNEPSADSGVWFEVT